jgi:hypothetical protein
MTHLLEEKYHFGDFWENIKYKAWRKCWSIGRVYKAKPTNY